jgi:hypothetical protein
VPSKFVRRHRQQRGLRQRRHHRGKLSTKKLKVAETKSMTIVFESKEISCILFQSNDTLESQRGAAVAEPASPFCQVRMHPTGSCGGRNCSISPKEQVQRETVLLCTLMVAKVLRSPSNGHAPMHFPRLVLVYQQNCGILAINGDLFSNHSTVVTSQCDQCDATRRRFCSMAYC